MYRHRALRLSLEPEEATVTGLKLTSGTSKHTSNAIVPPYTVEDVHKGVQPILDSRRRGAELSTSTPSYWTKRSSRSNVNRNNPTSDDEEEQQERLQERQQPPPSKFKVEYKHLDSAEVIDFDGSSDIDFEAILALLQQACADLGYELEEMIDFLTKENLPDRLGNGNKNVSFFIVIV